MDWSILGIEPTKDKKAISAAYRQKLRVTNPEDRPEEFKALRAAYEQAMELADQEASIPVVDDSPVALWMEEVTKLYDNYALRLDPVQWKKLMTSEVCIGLDTRHAAEEALLKFLMKCYHLPKNVWLVLDETFEFSKRAEELYETWPRDFIDHAVLSGIRWESSLDYALFIPGINGKDCDTYRKLYYRANQTPLEELGPILEQMDALSESHPYGEGLRCRFYMHTGREQEGKDGFRRLAQEYPDDPAIAVEWAELCFDDGNITDAQQIACRILKSAPKHLGAKMIYAKCLAAEQQYHEAKERAYEMLHDVTDNPVFTNEVTQLMKAWNEQLIQQRQARYESNPNDTENLIELAWCYAQNDRREDAFALALKIDPKSADVYEYHNLIGKLYYNNKKYAEAVEHLQIVENLLRELADDGTEKTSKRRARLPELLQILGYCLMQLGRDEEAKEKFAQSLEEAPDNIQVLSMMGKILYNSGDYEEAVDIFMRVLRISPDSWMSEMLMALCLYCMHRDQEAFHAVNRALALQQSDLTLYLLKMQILVRNEVFGEVHQILDFLKEAGAPEDIACDFIRAELTEYETKDAAEALNQYRNLANRVKAGEPLIFSEELYYHLAVLTGNQMDLSQEENRKTVLELIDQGLAFHEQNTDLLSYKAWVLQKGNLIDDAIEMYKKVLQKNPRSTVALRGVADLYYKDLAHNAQLALMYYEKLLEIQQTADLFFYAATCKRHLGDMEGARYYYLKELEMDPDDVDGYRGLAFVAESHKDHENSLELIEKALSIMEQYNQQYNWLVNHKIKLLRRLGRYEDALNFAAEAAERYGYDKSLQLQFDICCQFGLWDRAQQVLDQWKRKDRNDPDLMAANGKFYMLQGKLFKASMAMGPAKHKLPVKQIEDFRLQLNELECNHERRIQILSQRVKQNPNDDHMLLNLAHAYSHAGKLNAAQGAAMKVLVMLDDILSQKPKNEALYRSRRSLALTILGRSEEARAELERTRELPLCDFCEYGSCKDADIYEAFIEEILGNDEEAAKLYAAGKSNWPDELDFAAGAARLKKKGRK